MSLGARIARLERATPRDETCRERGGPPAPGTEFRLEFDEGKPDRPERCFACGRQLVFRLEFDRSG